MSESVERRVESAHRIPFEANVEIGGPAGESFEARAIDLSGEGMHLKTAYLPEVGQPLSCTFDAGDGAIVSVGAEVVWRRDQGDGGEFGIQFTNVDDDQAKLLADLLDRSSQALPLPAKGARVRLHIDGLGGPMRGVVKHPSERQLVVGSEIAFLQLGRDLQVEEKETGHKRPARIDRVDVEIDPASKTPHLVISLVYTADGKAQMAAADLTDPTPQKPVEVEPDWLSHAKASLEKVKPLMGTMASRVKTFTKAMSERAEGANADVAKIKEPTLRTTAPPPNGALRAEGKRVVRGEGEEIVTPGFKRLPIGRKGLAAAAAMTGMLLVGSLALRSSEPAPEAAPVEVTATAPTPSAEPAAPGSEVVAANAAPAAMPANVAPQAPGANPMEPTMPAVAMAEAPRHEPSIFGNPDVRRGNVLRLRLDGPVERILGASEPTGFTVVVPGRKSVEVASPLAEKDERIASIRVTNVASGAELSVVFKDGVPKYLVRGHGDELEIVLANKGEIATASAAPAEPKAKAEPAEAAPAPKATKSSKAARAHKKKSRKHHG
jgi:hypothetical protein